MTDIKTCPVCGAEFEARGCRRYCSPKCRLKASNEMRRIRLQEARPRTTKTNGSLAAMAKKARDHGMTYGQYVLYLKRKEELS